MWLDRLAGQASGSGSSTPQSVSRSYSPLPRRTSSNLSPYVTSQRQGQSPRGSSLSLISSESSASLLTSSRRPNGSSLKQSSAPVAHPTNSIETLEKLLGKAPSSTTAGDTEILDPDFDLDFDFGGLSLKELAASQMDVDAPPPNRKSQKPCDYESDQAKFEDLHRSITACDDILNSVETNLTSFRNDLASVAADIESLQDRSTALNKRLDNRKEVEKALNPLVEELSVSPEVITKITTGIIDETWPKMLTELDRRATAHKKKFKETQQSKATSDLGPLLEKLVQKAVERIRDVIVAQIKALRSPNINAQIIQQQNFLKFKELYTFLYKHHSKLAEEIALAYMNTMRWYYHTQFTRYEKALGKIKLHILDKNDTLNPEETTRMASVLSAGRITGPPHDAFNIGRRVDIIKAGDQPALSSFLAEEDKATHYLEVPFRSFNLALIDNAAVEYTFLATYFSPSLSFSHISKNFNYIFEPTFELGKTLSKTLIGDTYDALGVLLCIRLNQHFAFELQRRRVPAVDSYINATNMLLWPRLQVIIDRHCECVRQLTNSTPAKASKSTAEQAKISAAPHQVTQRFGQLLHGFLSLSVEAGDDEPVAASLQRLRTDVEAFLTRFGNSFGADKRKTARFMYNNYSLILTIISDTTGKLADEHQRHFEELKTAYQDGD
ncbi:Vps52 / Sac2 family protein [Cordyceps fumosorosea ARSEF 2679]|uniref:Vps52 / Sac2 family protein n=1 Tax=Cordyceps fumosorosea (strain ARSEF 2679) TaxID=1081104 RepID=A0A168AQ25_CORFA|nr:Vps52 / Sac2 family protein [Cordyceps fumosorosea ARSEF 2679]OAA69035.1 Vps52 / Sac2 family protein [Cordyceps fumosorosea ARSEF 2679]